MSRSGTRRVVLARTARTTTAVTAAGGRVVTYSGSGGPYVPAKALVADYGTSTAKGFAGSENFSDNSLNHNRALALIVGDSGVPGGVGTTFGTDFADGAPFTG